VAGGLGLIASVVLLIASTQVPVQPLTAPDIGQRTWQWLRSDYSDGTAVEAADPSLYTVMFQANGRMSIRADCNTGSASYSIDGDQLSITPGPMTLAACGPDSQDSIFLTDLMSAVAYGFEDQQLMLSLDSDRGSMAFAEMPGPTLAGGPWLVTGINNGRGAVSSVVGGTLVTAEFGDDGRVTGRTGCNDYQATYTTDDDTIAIGPVFTTRRACPSEAAATQEQAFLNALAAASTYEVSSDRATLRDPNGAAQLSLARRAR
jgi:heat shock protein HslJ